MNKTFSPIYVFVALLLFVVALYAEDSKPKAIGKQHREEVLKAIAKAQAAQLQFFRTRDQATSALQAAERSAQDSQKSLDAALVEARKADNVSEACQPTIDLAWDCPKEEKGKKEK